MARLCENCRKAGRVWCPHDFAERLKTSLSGKIKQEMFGPSPPNILVGHSSYPNVCWGPLVFADSASLLRDDPKKMYGMSLEQILKVRSFMVRGIRRGDVRLTGRMLQEVQEAVMSITPVDVEARFSKQPRFSLELDDVLHPIGAFAPIEKFKIAQNPEIPKKVDEVVDEKMKAEEALVELLLSGFDVHYLSKLLSAGILGQKGQRKLVPTRWAITAADDIAAKRFISSVKDCPIIEQVCVFSNTYLDNHFEILLLPGKWEYEQFEAHLENPEKIAWEHESFWGRTSYAESEGGGYYAARFAVAEALYKSRLQARVVVFREIGKEYSVPVGVWEVRENVRAALRKPPKKFESIKQAILYLKASLKVPIQKYLKRSLIIGQMRLDKWIGF
ncbi:MAG: hypothetical protein QXN37_03280 [Candidatus Anstonellaceae archaeon]